MIFPNPCQLWLSKFIEAEPDGQDSKPGGQAANEGMIVLTCLIKKINCKIHITYSYQRNHF